VAETNTIVIASDLSGFPLKKAITEYLQGRDDIELIDLGIESEKKPAPYFEQAAKVAEVVSAGKADKGILVCGTGQGMAIVANKHKNVYACVVDGVFSGERAKIVNDANVITLGGWITAPFLGLEIVKAWLSMQFAQKMEPKKDFLANSLKYVREIESKNFV